MVHRFHNSGKQVSNLFTVTGIEGKAYQFQLFHPWFFSRAIINVIVL